MVGASFDSFLDLPRENRRVAERWIERPERIGTLQVAGLLLVAAALYGSCVGAWRSPLMGLYTAVKMPLLLSATALVNGCINALIARRFGFELDFGASLRSVLAAFALASVILAAFAPVVLLFDFTLPPPDDRDGKFAHALLGLTHVFAVAFAGIVAVSRQRRWLAAHCVEPAAASRVVAWWLAINLLVGAQLSWNLRPWFGSPGIDVQFLRDDPFRGTFAESLFLMFKHVSR